MDLIAAIGFESTHTPAHVILARLLVAAVLGGVIGYERGVEASTAGLRTHMLIALAAALFTTLAFEIYHTARGGGSTSPDPVRIIQSVTMGVAFLGGGAIFQQRDTVRGLTTGAGMWLAGAIGITAGLGYYLIALVVAGFALIVLSALRTMSHRSANQNDAGTKPPGDR